MVDLIQHSLEIIKNNQYPSGAYVASPNFDNYHYCWFRDGAFTAYAMDLYGKVESAHNFFEWAANVILAREDMIHHAVLEIKSGRTLAQQDYLHTRYAMDGRDGVLDEWPNHQLDGFGTWLWSLGEHAHLTNSPLPPHWHKAAQLVGDYLYALWDKPCYDCWEEFPDKIHTYTLGSIYAGIRALGELNDTNYRTWLQEIREQVNRVMVYNDHLVKFNGSYTVDASLIGLAVPYGMLDPGDGLVRETIQRIEITLARTGGVHRYATDTYYGGGEWILLTAWLGWYYATIGKTDRAEELLTWIEAAVNARGELPEQVPANLIDPNYYQPWVERWGTIATPLLWSHANYLILNKMIHP